MPLDVVSQARTWIGTPVHHQGRCRAGVDCVGLVVCVARELGIQVDNDYTDYVRRGSIPGFLQYFIDSPALRVPLPEKAAGDIVVLREMRHPVHCGIIGEDERGLTLIHAHSVRQRVIEETLTEHWERRLVAAFRMPDVIPPTEST